MLDSAATRQDFKRHEISDIGFLRSGDKIVDGITKSINQAKIIDCLSGTLAVVSEQWIIRDKVTCPEKTNQI